MRTWIPWDEMLEENMKIPGYAERLEAACQRLEAQLAVERAETGYLPQSPLPPFSKGGKDCPRIALVRKAPKRKPRAFSTKLTRERTVAL